MGMHSEKLEKARGNKPQSQIRADKCARSKERNIQRRERVGAEIQERLDFWRSLSPEAQLKELDKRPGNSKKQRTKILAKMKN